MLGFLSLVGPPTAALHATPKQWVEQLVAQESLFQGVWNVASNQPDLTPAVMNPLHSYSWVAQTVDPAVPEIAPAALPGIGGNSVAATDTIIWNNTLQIYEQIRGAISVSQMLIADGPPATAFHGQQWWDSDAGKCYVYYDDGTSQAWVQTSGGGGATKAEVFFGDLPPDPTFSGELWWDTSTGNMMLNQNGVWVQTNVEEAPLDGQQYMRQNAGWAINTSTVATNFTNGDVKQGFQTTDHQGWVLLNGRAVSTLTVTQQAVAAQLGFTANLPNGDKCSIRMDPGAALGIVGGSQKITQANLPAINTANSGVITTSGYDPGAVTTSSAGAHTHNVTYYRATGSNIGSDPGTNSDTTNASTKATASSGAHTHTIDMPNHTHTVAAHAHSLGGSGTDYYVKAIVANFFVFLGV
jgi:hypothetical protein